MLGSPIKASLVKNLLPEAWPGKHLSTGHVDT